MTALLPRPRSSEPCGGALTLCSPLKVLCAPEWRGVVDVFAEDLARSVGWEVRAVREGERCDVELRVDDACGPEGYTLRVTDRVDISASSAAGFSYALTILRQLGPAQLWSRERAALAEWIVPGVSVADAPSHRWRGAHLDVARHFFGADVVMRLIDQLSAHRLNRLHLHLNDDQGWRIEVPAWPRLTSVGATRSGSPVGHERDDRCDEVPHGGYFTAADVTAILSHARRRHVQVVPEIDLPGHAQAVLAAYPQFANTDEPVDVWTHWGISERVLSVEPEAIDFAESVLHYVASLFPGGPVHIGGDECPTTEWAASPAALEIMRRNGFADVSQLQTLYTGRLSAALRDDGHEVLAWDEVLDAEVGEGVVICAWRGVEKGIEAARRGLDVVMAPMQFLYFDWLSSESAEEPVAVAPVPFFTTWERVYGFDVIPEGLEPELRHHVRGAQVQIWTEYIDSVARLDYMTFPRLCAFSEVAWGTAGDLTEFRPRLEGHLARLDAMGVAYRPLDPTLP